MMIIMIIIIKEASYLLVMLVVLIIAVAAGSLHFPSSLHSLHPILLGRNSISDISFQSWLTLFSLHSFLSFFWNTPLLCVDTLFFLMQRQFFFSILNPRLFSMFVNLEPWIQGYYFHLRLIRCLNIYHVFFKFMILHQGSVFHRRIL